MSIQHLFSLQPPASIPCDNHVIVTQSHLAHEIEAAAHDATQRLELDPNYFLGTVYPRGRSRFRWNEDTVPMWRLGIDEPLWLGTDQIVYEGYDVEVWDGYEYPAYLQALSFSQCSIPTLLAILAAIRSLTGQ